MRSDAQKRADKVYRTKQLSNGKNKQINATLKIDDYTLIDNYCRKSYISKAQLIVQACKAWIENHPVDNNNNHYNDD